MKTTLILILLTTAAFIGWLVLSTSATPISDVLTDVPTSVEVSPPVTTSSVAASARGEVRNEHETMETLPQADVPVEVVHVDWEFGPFSLVPIAHREAKSLEPFLPSRENLHTYGNQIRRTWSVNVGDFLKFVDGLDGGDPLHVFTGELSKLRAASADSNFESVFGRLEDSVFENLFDDSEIRQQFALTQEWSYLSGFFAVAPSEGGGERLKATLDSVSGWLSAQNVNPVHLYDALDRSNNAAWQLTVPARYHISSELWRRAQEVAPMEYPFEFMAFVDRRLRNL